MKQGITASIQESNKKSTQAINSAGALTSAVVQNTEDIEGLQMTCNALQEEIDNVNDFNFMYITDNETTYDAQTGLISLSFNIESGEFKTSQINIIKLGAKGTSNAVTIRAGSDTFVMSYIIAKPGLIYPSTNLVSAFTVTMPVITSSRNIKTLTGYKDGESNKFMMFLV